MKTIKQIAKASVVVPPVQDFYFTPHRFSSLGARSVALILKNAGVAVDFFDFPSIDKTGKILPLPKELSYLKPFLIDDEIGKFSFFRQYHRYGLPVETCADMIKAALPDICCISCFAYCYALETTLLIDHIKAKVPGLPVIVGGAGVSCFPEYFIDAGADYAVVGEAEVSLPFLIRAFKNEMAFSEVPNLWSANSSFCPNPVIIRRPAEQEIVLPIARTASRPRSVQYSTVLSRGCPRECDFCSNHLTHGKEFRKTPLALVSEAFSGFSIDRNDCNKTVYINLEDDNSLCDSAYLLDCMACIRSAIPNAKFLMENGIDFTLLTPQLCIDLIDSGLCQFNLSIISANETMLRQEHRNLEKKHFESLLDTISARGIKSITYFICGLKNDSLKNTSYNLSYLSKLQTLIGISPFYPIPGLHGFTEKKALEGIAPFLCAGSSMHPWNESIPTETMVTAFRLARYINATKSGKVSELEQQVIDIINDTESLHTITKQGKGIFSIIEVPKQDKTLVRDFLQDR